MKVNSGIYKNRKINRTNLETTRETSDMVKQAIFNMIGSYFYDEEVALDLFSGSGSLGIEALSRKMSFVYFNDLNKQAFKVIKENLNTLKVEDKNYKLTNLDYKELLKNIDKKLDYIFLDPPYDLKDITIILDEIFKYDILNKGCKIIFEMHKDTNYDLNNDKLVITNNKLYGIKRIVIYEYII